MEASQGYPQQQTGKRKGKKARLQQQRQLGPRQTAFKQRPQQHLGNLGSFFGGLQHPGNLGPYFGATQQPPSLEDMRAANKQGTRHHFSGPRQKYRRPPRSTPKSIPRAPDHPHTTVFPPGANPLDTPAPEIAAFPTAADKLEAEGLNSGLDFYGTNEGLLSMFRNRAADSTSEQSELEGPSGDEDDDQHQQQAAAGGERPTSLQARLAEQEAYIANLEDENLRLRERLEMLQQELNDQRHGGGNAEQGDSGFGWSHGSHSEEDHSIAHVAEAHGMDAPVPAYATKREEPAAAPVPS